jgi:hypothetical protein
MHPFEVLLLALSQRVKDIFSFVNCCKNVIMCYQPCNFLNTIHIILFCKNVSIEEQYNN